MPATYAAIWGGGPADGLAEFSIGTSIYAGQPIRRHGQPSSWTIAGGNGLRRGAPFLPWTEQRPLSPRLLAGLPLGRPLVWSTGAGTTASPTQRRNRHAVAATMTRQPPDDLTPSLQFSRHVLCEGTENGAHYIFLFSINTIMQNISHNYAKLNTQLCNTHHVNMQSHYTHMQKSSHKYAKLVTQL